MLICAIACAAFTIAICFRIITKKSLCINKVIQQQIFRDHGFSLKV